MLIMKVLSLEPMHGWGICERIQLISQDQLQVNQGSLYPALHKLTQEGWIRSYWGLTENNRKARYYRLTRAGENQLGLEAANWDRLVAAVTRVMATS
jgi:transcriptional regulator